VRALVQRVRQASVGVGGRRVAGIGPGLCVLLGVADTDGPADVERLAHRVASLRIFENEGGKLDLNVVDTGGSALVVSQFTLIADTTKGNRPSFSRAARPEAAEPLYRAFCEALAQLGVPTERGVFGAEMLVEIANDGPVTILLDT
jgi:D-tyrosyl-tRNA(Tyr) deacylase